MNTVVFKFIPAMLCLVLFAADGLCQKRYQSVPVTKSRIKEKQDEKKTIERKKRAFQLSILFNANKSDVFAFPTLNGVEPNYYIDEDGELVNVLTSDVRYAVEVGLHKPVGRNFLVGGFFEYGRINMEHPGYDLVSNGSTISYKQFYGIPRMYNLGVDLRFKYRFFFIGIRAGVRMCDYGASFKIVYEDQLTQIDAFNSDNLGVGVFPLLATNAGLSFPFSRSFELVLRSGVYFNSDRILAEDYTLKYVNLQGGLGVTYKL